MKYYYIWALASRLEDVLPNIVSNDQTRFIKNCQPFFNIRCLLNVLYSEQQAIPV